MILILQIYIYEKGKLIQIYDTSSLNHELCIHFFSMFPVIKIKLSLRKYNYNTCL